jgi:hypothetical protein
MIASNSARRSSSSAHTKERNMSGTLVIVGVCPVSTGANRISCFQHEPLCIMAITYCPVEVVDPYNGAAMR